MDLSVIVPRARLARIIVVAVVVTLVAIGLAALVRTGPATAARHATIAETVLTLRTNGDHDELWQLSTTGGAATKVGDLPGSAAWTTASPNGTTVACLPMLGKPEVWIGYGPGAPKTISLQSAGIKTLNYISWTTNSQLIVAGSKKAKDYMGYNDSLYLVDVGTGAVTPFRGLSGCQPSVSFATGKIVYVKFKKLDNGNKKNGYTPKYRESLMLTTLNGSGAGTELASQDYRAMADYRAFNWPQIAAGGFWVVYGQTGSDVSVTYNIALLGDAYVTDWIQMPQGTPPATGWAPSSPLLAFGGQVTVSDSLKSCVYIADVDGGAIGRTGADVFSGAGAGFIEDLSWSDGTQIVVDAADMSASDSSTEGIVMLLDTKDLTKATKLGAGHLSVWVR